MKGATITKGGFWSQTNGFNPRSHEGSDQVISGFFQWAQDVSIHAPHEGSDTVSHTFQAIIQRFNPRSHEGSDSIKNIYYYLPYVSIHAPMKGATYLLCSNHGIKVVSIHAPMKGATIDLISRYLNSRFQSTLP